MINRLSSHYQKEIALGLMSVFFISGLGGLKAQIMNTRELTGKYYFHTSGIKNSLQNGFSENGNFNPLGGAFSSDNDDEKDKGKKAKQLVSNLRNFSGKFPQKISKTFIGGPSQPEMTAFKSVGSDNMVSPFTGDFSYNIPLLDVGGYPVNMFYSSGISMDQEASWVGLGWNINPGTVTRNMRGLPDDFNGTDKITKTQSFRDDKTFGITTGANIKLAGFPRVGLGASMGLSWNNKLGIAAEAGINGSLSLGGKNSDPKTYWLTTSAGLNASSRTGASVAPSISIQKELGKGAYGNLTGSIGVGFNYSSRVGLSSMHLDMNVSESWKKTYNEGQEDQYTASGSITHGSSSGTLSFAYPSVVPAITKPLTRESYSLELSAGFEAYALNPHFKLRGYYNRTYLADDDKITYHPAYGMLNLQGGEGNKDALLDFNRANEGMYTPNTPTIAMPVYTYDVFTINGEGTGGSFRAYRGDVGHARDPYVKTKDNAFGLGVDLGFGNLVHVGADLNYVYSPTEAGDWEMNNMARSAFGFQGSNGTYQSAYFKNPGEKTVPDPTFQSAVSGEDLVRFKMTNLSSPNPLLLSKLVRYDATKNFLGEKTITPDDTKKMSRDKRTQVISYLTAEETERIGIQPRLYSYNASGNYENKVIYSTNCNRNGIDSFYRNHDVVRTAPSPLVLGDEATPFRHQHHISEIDVLGTDGKRYVYGLPVYNKKQVNVTFSINANQKKSDTKAEYDLDDAGTSNSKGRDWILEKEEIPAYTHSYLLTELLSPNYVDVTGNGISEDDMGDAVKFNYSKYADYKWRTPVNNPGSNTPTASYSSGLKTDEKDDKAHYVYGEREAWYLYSIESKNMVARFYVKSDRKDGRPVTGESGTVDTDPSKGMKRLEKISLFSKGDLAKFGDNARPIKTIRFFQSYKLCKNLPGASDLGSNIEYGQGKLTLDSIWIMYNGNTRKPKSHYVFYYPDTNNPNYSFEQSDRWGTYKPKADNPSSSLSNEEYPYSVQDGTKADKNAAAWALNKILLPSGGLITVDYESDTYGYVQDKKAASMCQILGFGTSETSLPSSGDLPKLYANNGAENDRVYIQLPYAVTATGLAGKTEFASRYLSDVKQLYLKLFVTMPTGSGLSGIAGDELIPVYADIDNYGLISSTVAWIKIKSLETGHTPMVQTGLQFLTRQLPGKAYKGYDLSEESGLKSIVTAMAGMLNSVGSMFNGEINTLKGDLKCQQVTLYKCFARLTSPNRSKYGGGHRVKRITINDSWDKMTGQRAATYGQEYRYTTTELINGKMETISSGVASWEPSIGSDENPCRDIMRFVDHNKGGPYDYGTVEMPLGEMFYPAPVVGYSRVEVFSIHRDTVKNHPTRQVSEFYTNKEFPYKSTCTDLSGEANARYEPAKIMQLLRIDMMKGIAQSQGFLIETNDMHGKLKSQAVYAVTDPVNPVSYTENFYNIKQATDKTYSFTHDFPVISKADGKVTSGLIGRDIEVMTDFRQHHSETYTANLSINFDGFIVGFFPVPLTNLLQPVVREGTMYRSAAILKLVTHYGMVDSVVSIDKGSMVSTKNLVYDAESGNPLLTRTQNEHNKPIYNFTYPAHWAYSGMGPAYKNIDAVFSGLTFRHGILSAGTNGGADILNVLESGDELYVVSKNSTTQTYIAPCDDPAGINASNYAWNTLEKNPANRIWAVNTAKAGANPGGWVFMDAIGNPYNATEVYVRIIRSGKRNMLDQSVAVITSLSSPVINNQLVLNDATGIIQTTAATYKDNWRVDNSWYKVTESQQSFAYAKVHKSTVTPSDFATITWNYKKWDKDPEGVYDFQDRVINKEQYISLYKNSTYGRNNRKGWVEDRRKNTFLLYDLNSSNAWPSIPSSVNVYKTFLSLYSHTNVLFPLPGYPGSGHVFNFTAHGDSHDNTNSQNKPNSLADISGLLGSWYSTTPSGPGVNNDPNASDWISSYFNSNSNNVSYGKGIIPYASNGWQNYFGNNRVDVTLPVLTSSGSPIFSQRKVGLKLKLFSDEVPPGDRPKYDLDYRCFWSPSAARSCGDKVPCPFGTPILDYYYYSWGDVNNQTNYDNDPLVNTLLTKYINTVTATYCKSKFSRKAMNPYVEGILGNWRVDSTYTYYGDRKENDAGTVVDTRNAGTILNYQGFWNLPATPAGNTPVYLIRNNQAANVWVWNSAITQYNRKGYEIENTDPLGRFNSGLYGYNQQLPVAVANNSRVSEILFDGFEDYDYQTGQACVNCTPHRHFSYTSLVAGQLDATQRHTGQYSLKVNAGQSIQLQAPVMSLSAANAAYGLVLQNSTTSYTNQALGSGGTAGTGLKASWYNHAVINNATMSFLEPVATNAYPQATLIYTQAATAPNLAYNNTGASPAPGVAPSYFSIKWEGKLQAPASGTYRFRINGDNGFRLKINGNTVSGGYWNAPTPGGFPDGGGLEQNTAEVALTVGQVYPIEISYYNQRGAYNFSIQWQYKPSGSSQYNNYTTIPLTNLYPPTATSFRDVITTQQTCYRLDSSQVTGNALTDSLSLLQNKKMLVGAWVKVGTANCCYPATYDNNSNSITISFDNQNWSSYTFKPAGPVIEGWQRYEAPFDIPNNAVSIKVSLNNTTSTPVFFDDLRLQPYNSNMKTYVYNSSSLRLMAELDENNYASLYEYDDDGTLTRVKKETQAGVKTITETRSATQKKINE